MALIFLWDVQIVISAMCEATSAENHKINFLKSLQTQIKHLEKIIVRCH
jgi:hypothetical protein